MLSFEIQQIGFQYLNHLLPILTNMKLLYESQPHTDFVFYDSAARRNPERYRIIFITPQL